MSLKLILSKLKSVFRLRPLNKEKQKKEEEKEQKKRRGIFQFLWQHFFSKKNLLKKKAKASQKKSLAKKNKKKSSSDKELGHNDYADGITHIQKIVQGYEEFIQRDFSMIIREANAQLREWKVNLISKGNDLAGSEVKNLSHNLQEISSLYINTNAMLNEFSQDFSNYQETVRSVKRQISPGQKINQLQSQLDKVVAGLEKGKIMTDLEHNHDYKYLSRYISKKNEGARTISL